MKFLSFRFNFIIGLTSLVTGVAPMVAVSSSLNDSWMTIESKDETMRVAFPKKPLDLKFNIPDKKTRTNGKLHIYSTPIKKGHGLLALSILTISEINKNSLEPKQFKENFQTYLVNYLYNEPHQFNHRQKFKSRLDEFEGIPLLSFQFSYKDKDNDDPLLLKGAALIHGHKLYQLFYLAPENEYDEEILTSFVSSFELIN